MSMGTNIVIDVAGRIDKLNNDERQYEGYKRGNSWMHCHNAFVSYSGRNLSDSDFDYLALQLAFYLASWGMYRGSSFLLELDYKIHVPAVEIMMEERYRDLFKMENPFVDPEIAKKYKILMFGEEGVYNSIEKHYLDAHKSIANQRRKDDENQAEYNPAQESDTLITKILLGVYGCIPAYDRFFKRGLSMFGRQQWLKSDGNALFKKPTSLGELLQEGALRQELEEYYNAHPEYTFMKVVDMYFFSLGAYFEEGYDKLSSDEKKAKTEVFKEKIGKEYR